jgi:hypothetical protein
MTTATDSASIDSMAETLSAELPQERSSNSTKADLEESRACIYKISLIPLPATYYNVSCHSCDGFSQSCRAYAVWPR